MVSHRSRRDLASPAGKSGAVAPSSAASASPAKLRVSAGVLASAGVAPASDAVVSSLSTFSLARSPGSNLCSSGFLAMLISLGCGLEFLVFAQQFFEQRAVLDDGLA